MIYGIGTGVLWALQTILLSIVLSNGVFVNSEQHVLLAPFVGAFLNDTISGIILFLLRKAKKKYRRGSVVKALKTKNGRILMLSGLFGGPLGMTSYLLAIKYIGASYAAVISSLYPAIGSVAAWIFLKDRLTKKQLIGLIICAFGVIAMAGIPEGNIDGSPYFLFAFASAFFWGMEAVISSYAMKDGEISYEVALQIRHITSILCYAILFLPILHAWGFTLQVMIHRDISYLLLTAFFATGSYLLYYKAIYVIGAAKAMALNITYMLWSVLLSVFIFKVIPQKYEMISMGILLCGVLMVVLYGKTADADHSV